MPLQLKMEMKTEYLHVEVAGTYGLDETKQLILDVLKESQRQYCAKILVDFRSVSGDVPIFERYELGKFIAEKQIHQPRVAVLDVTERILPDRFMEKVSVNRGVLYKAASTPQEAFAWLDVQAPPEKT